MAFNNRFSGSDMLGGIKDRLGIGGGNRNNYNDYDDYDAFDDYDDYDAYADNFDDYSTYDDEQSDRDREMDRYGRVTERDASARRSRRSYTDIASSDLSDRRRDTTGHASLVSIDDIKANTRRMMADSASAGRSTTRARDSYRSSDYMSSGSVEREFLPDPMVPAEHHSDSTEGSKRPSAYDSLLSSGSSSSFSSSSTSHPVRGVVVVAPVSYNDVEKVAKAMRKGDVVVLNLRNVAPDLTQRVLDFSFGVTGALDGKVDCIGEKVFALTVGATLSEAERLQLRSQGVVL